MAPATGEAKPRGARLRVERRLTDTPLARQHEHALRARGERARRPLPWKSFSRANYPEGALRIAAASQRALALGEYGAVNLFAHMTVDLSLHGAPLDLISACARASSDELRHADYALSAAGLLAGEPASAELDREGLGKVLGERLSLEDLDRMMLETGLMSETLAAALISGCGRGASEPLLKALFASLLADEVHHARLGWYYMAWRAPQWSRAERQRIADHAGSMLVGLERRYWKGRDAPRGCEEAATALGVLGSIRQREVVRAVAEEEIVPGLDALGLGASHAWRLRKRGGRGQRVARAMGARAKHEHEEPARGAAFPWRVLDRPITPQERAALARSLRGLLAWQRTMARWPKAAGGPDATPFVSLYAHGELRGCCGSAEGESGERLARAFVQALGDARHGGARPGDRADLVAQVTHVRGPARAASVDEACALIEPGTHGVALVSERSPVILIPSVARDGGLTARKLVEALARKAGMPVEALSERPLFLFTADETVARPRAIDDRASARSSVSLATEWLSRLVRDDGFVHFGVDSRARSVTPIGLMHHGRAAVVVRALAQANRGYASDAARARTWLAAEVRRALHGESVPGWPAERDRAAGSIALACLAGTHLEAELAAFVGDDPFAASPWHAAQVVAALGPRAPEPLWRTCLHGLESEPWAPWTAIAAHARGDHATLERTVRVLEASIRASGPHEGGVGRTEVPELALTAITIEALAPLVAASSRTRAAVTRARAFLERWQFRPGRVPAALDPAFAEGAFPLSPVASFARGDVTAHAVLALHPAPVDR